MRYILSILLLCGLCAGAWAQPAEKKPEPPPPPEFGVAGKFRTQPTRIKPTFYNPPAVSLPHPFSPVAALRQLYPGAGYQIPHPKLPADTLQLAEWSCPACPVKWVNGWIPGQKLRFPLTDDNQTQWHDTLAFTDDSGRQNIFISFATTPNMEGEDFLPSGRYNCAYMGLAWYRNTGAEWQLQAFSPVVGCFGAFQTLPPLQWLRLAPNRYACMLLNANGGPGQPYVADMYLIAAEKRQFRVILQSAGVSCTNDARIAYIPTIEPGADAGAQGYPPLRVRVEGHCSRTLPAGGDMRLMQEVQPHLYHQGACHFSVVRTYQYTKNQYQLTHTATEIDGQ